MVTTTNSPLTVDSYIEAQPEPVRARLVQIRQLVREIAPDAEELISYKMPTFKLHGPLVYFSAYKNHIGMYPVPEGDEEFRARMAPYTSHKSTAQWPHKQPLPLDLITSLVKSLIAENVKHAQR